MFSWLRHLCGWILSRLGSRNDLVLENPALREQLLALHATRPRRRLSPRHKLFWIVLRSRSGWQKPLVLVTPPDIKPASDCTGNGSPELSELADDSRPEGTRELIYRMAAENPTWGAPLAKDTPAGRLKRVSSGLAALRWRSS
jgi:hypothetical protein